MNKIVLLNVGYGKRTLVNEYYKGQMSSRIFYGSVELEKSGVYDVRNVSLNSKRGLIGMLRNNLMMLQRCDVVFMSYLFVSPFFLLSFMKRLGLTKKKIIVISHKTIKPEKNLIKRYVYNLIYAAFDVVFFHSTLNMEECISLKTIKSNQARFLYWGDDLNYVDNAYPNRSMGNYFVSTGREQRDYSSLIKAFRKRRFNLEIYTNRINYDNHYDFLMEAQNKDSNILIEFVERNNDSAIKLARRIADCFCVVIPLQDIHINYCLGLTSIVEAMAMGKPVISTYNPYSPIDIEKEGIGLVVNENKSWLEAIEYMNAHKDEAREMGKRGRLLAERLFNINHCAHQLESVIEEG